MIRVIRDKITRQGPPNCCSPPVGLLGFFRIIRVIRVSRIIRVLRVLRFIY